MLATAPGVPPTTKERSEALLGGRDLFELPVGQLLEHQKLMLRRSTIKHIGELESPEARADRVRGENECEFMEACVRKVGGDADLTDVELALWNKEIPSEKVSKLLASCSSLLLRFFEPILHRYSELVWPTRYVQRNTRIDQTDI